MKHRIAFCVGLTALGVAGIMATPAEAQVYLEPGGQPVPPQQEYGGGLPPSEILMAVRSSGLRPLTQPARLGPMRYAVLASDNMGGQLRVVVHAHTGRILNATPAYDPRFAYAPMRPRGLVPVAPPEHAGAPPTYAAPPADLRTPTAPPPRTARAAPAPQTPPAQPSQNHGLAGGPDATGSVPTRPARTPLPRPRPTLAANDANAPAAPAAAAPVQARPVETSPEADVPAAAQAAQAVPSAAPAKPAPAETQMVPVAPLD